MSQYILIMIMYLNYGTGYEKSGTSLAQEFNSKEACMQAANAVISDVTSKRLFRVSTWGCFKKGESK